MTNRSGLARAPIHPRHRISSAVIMTQLDSHSSVGTYAYKYPTLTKLVGKPTPVVLRTLKKEVYANAQCVPSLQGGGNYGHLGYYLPRDDYRSLPGIHHPRIPGVAHVPIGPGRIHVQAD